MQPQWTDRSGNIMFPSVKTEFSQNDQFLFSSFSTFLAPFVLVLDLWKDAALTEFGLEICIILMLFGWNSRDSLGFFLSSIYLLK